MQGFTYVSDHLHVFIQQMAIARCFPKTFSFFNSSFVGSTWWKVKMYFCCEMIWKQNFLLFIPNMIYLQALSNSYLIPPLWTLFYFGFISLTSPMYEFISSSYPPVSQGSRELANLTERKNLHTPLHGVKEFVCLSVMYVCMYFIENS